MKEQIEVLNSALGYIDKMSWGVKEAVNAFQGGDEHRGLSFMPYIFDGLQWLIEAITLTVSVHQGKLELQDIIEKLKEMSEAFENNDYILVSDLLEYEVLPILEAWKSKINLVLAMEP